MQSVVRTALVGRDDRAVSDTDKHGPWRASAPGEACDKWLRRAGPLMTAWSGQGSLCVAACPSGVSGDATATANGAAGVRDKTGEALTGGPDRGSAWRWRLVDWVWRIGRLAGQVAGPAQ
jgi:hypothetical protein